MRDHHTGYDRFATDRCERVLLTLLGDVGPWSERIYLVGGLAPRYIEHVIEGDRLDDGGRSTVTVRVAGLLTYAVLKILAFQDRHENKDAYDLIFVVANYPGGRTAAGRASANSPIAGHHQVAEAITLLSARFADASHDGPHAYASFLADPYDDDETTARRRNEAVAAIDQYLAGFHQ